MQMKYRQQIGAVTLRDGTEIKLAPEVSQLLTTLTDHGCDPSEVLRVVLTKFMDTTPRWEGIELTDAFADGPNLRTRRTGRAVQELFERDGEYFHVVRPIGPDNRFRFSPTVEKISLFEATRLFLTWFAPEKMTEGVLKAFRGVQPEIKELEEVWSESVSRMNTEERRDYALELERLVTIVRATLPEYGQASGGDR